MWKLARSGHSVARQRAESGCSEAAAGPHRQRQHAGQRAGAATGLRGPHSLHLEIEAVWAICVRQGKAAKPVDWMSAWARCDGAYSGSAAQYAAFGCSRSPEASPGRWRFANDCCRSRRLPRRRERRSSSRGDLSFTLRSAADCYGSGPGLRSTRLNGRFPASS